MVSYPIISTQPLQLQASFAKLLCDTNMCFLVGNVSICVTTADADGEEAERGAPSAHAVWDHRGELAGEPHPEGVPQGLLPHPAGDTLPGRRAGETR